MKPAIQSALFAALAFTASAALAQTTNPAPYCSGSFDDGQNFALHYISNVHLGTLNHTSPAQEGALPHYFFYNNVAAPTLQPGQSYSISISHDPAGSSMHFCAAYIDFNGDHVFQDNERVLEQSEFVGTGIANPSVATFTVPATAVAGHHTPMRAIVFEDDNYSFGSGTTTAAHAKPCTADGTPSFDWGEAEDYNVTIAGATALEPAQETSLTMFPNPHGAGAFGRGQQPA